MHSLAKDVLKQMSLNNVAPDISTWTSIALGCDSWKDAKSLLEEMDTAKFRSIYVHIHRLTTNHHEIQSQN